MELLWLDKCIFVLHTRKVRAVAEGGVGTKKNNVSLGIAGGDNKFSLVTSGTYTITLKSKKTSDGTSIEASKSESMKISIDFNYNDYDDN
jgi:hypothetical protein